MFHQKSKNKHLGRGDIVSRVREDKRKAPCPVHLPEGLAQRGLQGGAEHSGGSSSGKVCDPEGKDIE